MNFKNNLAKFDEKEANIRISHRIYGKQLIKGKIKFIDDGQRVGVQIGTHEIFMYVNEVENIDVSKNKILIRGAIMEIEII